VQELDKAPDRVTRHRRPFRGRIWCPVDYKFVVRPFQESLSLDASAYDLGEGRLGPSNKLLGGYDCVTDVAYLVAQLGDRTPDFPDS
jgi:hypothetical protein